MHTFNGWTYSAEIDREPDCTKIFHAAVKGGKEVSIQHSPYQGISEEAFRAHVLLGFERRDSNWRNADVIAEAKARGSCDEYCHQDHRAQRARAGGSSASHHRP